MPRSARAEKTIKKKLTRFTPAWLLSHVALISLVVLTAPSVVAQDAYDSAHVLIVDPAASIIFNGNGWGHGVGMSQWGTRSRAEAGHSVQEILQFYYPGTNLVENYGYPPAPPTPPSPPPSTTASVAPTTNPQDPARILLATTDSTILTPEGFNRITIDNQNIPSDAQPTRAPAGTPITITRSAETWQISLNGVQACDGGCVGQTAQLHFATNTTVAISTTGRSYSHGRIHLVASKSDPNRFQITLDSLTVEKFLNDQHNVAQPGSATNVIKDSVDSPVEQLPEDTIRVALAATNATTLTPQGLNRITLDGNNVAVNDQETARAAFGTPITISRNNGWSVQFEDPAFASINLCPTGCAEVASIQLHFATGTSIAVSTTGRSYTHGRINLVAATGSTSGFNIILDFLTIPKFFNDPQGAIPASPGDPATTPIPEIDITYPTPLYPEESIGIHLATTAQTTLIPKGANRITIDGQGDIRVAPNTSVTFRYHSGHWHITYNGFDACGAGCVGRSAQLHFTTNTSVVVSNTGRSYSHGRINLVPTAASSEQFYVVVDRLTLEEYLRGVAEIPTDWHAVAQDTQAIAARSYAVTSLRERRTSSSWNRPFDLYATVQDQAYVGDTRELALMAEPWLAAVERTTGQTLFYGDEPVKAFYSSSNGGYTERSGYVFTQDKPYLLAVPDPFDQHPENPNFAWVNRYSIQDFSQWLNEHPDTAVGQLISMAIISGLGDSGRINMAEVKITGTKREIVISGTRLNNRIYTAAGQHQQPRPLSTKLTFTLPPPSVVASHSGDLLPEPSPPSGTTPPAKPVPDTYYLGVITGPDFCTDFSLGGPITYPHDSDGDGIADICSLRSTRREEAARQVALDKFETAAPDIYTFLLAEKCLNLLHQSFGEPDKEPEDQCAQFHKPGLNKAASEPSSDDSSTNPDTAGAQFFSGPVITSSDFCTIFSLGGPITYPHDSDGDGIADICSLKTTRRVAVARQQVLEELKSPNASFGTHMPFQNLFRLSCVEIAPIFAKFDFGESEKEALDACEPYIRS